MAEFNLRTGGVSSRGFGLSGLSDDDVAAIHGATLDVLERTGVFVESDEALDIFADGGCSVDRECHIVKIPPSLVEAAILSAPERVRLCGRDPKHDVVLEPGRVGFTNFSEGLMVIDPHTREHRASTKQDIADIARLNDYLSEMDSYGVAVGARDVPLETAAIHNTEAQLLNTTKPVDAGPLGREDARAIIAMAAEIVGGADELRERPIVFLGVCPVSPLKLPVGVTDVIIESSRAGLPDNILSMAMAGASSPVTLAGTLVTHNVEVLAGITLAQLTERGSPVIYGSSTTAMDLRLATASVGSPECALISAAVAFIAKQYRLPSFVAGA